MLHLFNLFVYLFIYAYRDLIEILLSFAWVLLKSNVCSSQERLNSGASVLRHLPF